MEGFFLTLKTLIMMENLNLLRANIPAIYTESIQGVVVSARLCTRQNAATVGKKGEILFPVVIRVAYLKERFEKRIGLRLTYEGYLGVVNSRGGSVYGSIREKQIRPVFLAYVAAVEELKKKGEFHIENLPKTLGDREEKPEEKPLYQYWNEYANGKDKAKTADYYRDSCRQFFMANGATKAMVGRVAVLSGKVLALKPSAFRLEMVDKWREVMTEAGNSTSSQAARLRALRAVLYDLEARKIIAKAPKLEMPPTTRRRDIFLTVPDIIKLRDYRGEGKVFSDWFVMLYLLNGANLRDISALVWPQDCDSEFTFIRSKTAGKRPYTVHIPITKLLEPYLQKYASDRMAGERVFPQILLGAKSERQVAQRVHDFNAELRKGLQPICKTLGIKTVSAEWARNSYITTLTWHGVSDAFIDDMVGHADGKVLSGYQGLISPKKRMKINSLLFTDPEGEGEE